jgi:processive 1,2-diacylglycerol beta-glucosyltransferase
MRVLILSASAGNGHLSAARALEKEFVRQGACVCNVDALNYAPRIFRIWFRDGYETLVRLLPRLWGSIYRSSDRPGPTYAFQTYLDAVCLKRLDRLIADERPDWIVCTQPLPQPRLAKLQAEHPDVRVAVVVTDVYPHRMWLRGRPQRYFVPVERTRELIECRRPGSGATTEVTGIPIDAMFASLPGQQDARRGLGRPQDERSVLLTSGGIGGGPIMQALEVLTRCGAADRVTVVCGRNRRAFAVCSDRVAALDCSADVEVVGHLPPEVYALHLAAADLVVGKPGGLTMSECMAAGRPMVIYAPLLIPGQEQANADYMCEAGFGVRASEPEELQKVVAELLKDRKGLEAMGLCARRHARPDAAQTIAARLMEAG